MQHPAKSLEQPRRATDETLAILSPTLELQHLWFRLAAARTAHSLALVPAERDLSTLAMAQSLAQVASSLPDSRVLIVNASLRDCLPPRGPVERPDIAFEDLTPVADDGPFPNCDLVDFSRLPADDAQQALLLAPRLLEHLAAAGKGYTAALFAVDSPLHQTRSIPLVRSADTVAVCFTLGRTTFDAARRLVELVGRDKVLGAVAVHP